MVPPNSSFAHANCNIVIDPHDQEIIWIQIDKAYENVLVTSAGKKKVAEMVLARQEGDKIPIVLINPTSIPRKINKGEIIATISPVDIIEEIRNEKEFIIFINNEKIQETVQTIHETSTNHSWRPGDRIKFTNKSLTEEQKQKLRDLINEFHMIFSPKMTKILEKLTQNLAYMMLS
jgi:hypothetical protein